jgi:hypothetical protein
MIKASCVTFDCADPDLVAGFWSTALDWRRIGDRVEPPDGGMYLEFGVGDRG